MIPDVVRTDRGSEMSSVNEELLALLAIKHVQGAAFTPRHQGRGEKAHQTIMNNHLILMNDACKAFPQEWAALVPELEYLCETAPREPHALSAFSTFPKATGCWWTRTKDWRRLACRGGCPTRR